MGLEVAQAPVGVLYRPHTSRPLHRASVRARRAPARKLLPLGLCRVSRPLARHRWQYVAFASGGRCGQAWGTGSRVVPPAFVCRMEQGGQAEYRRVRVPHHRYTPLREEWATIVGHIVEHMKLQVRMNTKLRTVELKVRACVSACDCRALARSVASNTIQGGHSNAPPLYRRRTRPQLVTSRRRLTSCTPSCSASR